MSKKEDEEMMDGSDDEELTPEPEPPPTRVSSSSMTTSDASSPRAARFGEGKEGRPARRERGVVGERAGFFERTGQFLHDVRSELRRVSWPTVKEVRNTTIITIIAVVFFAVYLWLVDHAFAFVIEQLQHFINWLFGLV